MDVAFLRLMRAAVLTLICVIALGCPVSAVCLAKMALNGDARLAEPRDIPFVITMMILLTIALGAILIYINTWLKSALLAYQSHEVTQDQDRNGGAK